MSLFFPVGSALLDMALTATVAGVVAVTTVRAVAWMAARQVQKIRR